MTMIFRRRAAPALALLTALAASGHTALAAVDCDSATDQATLNQCAAIAQKDADARLNAAYGTIMKRLADDSHGRGLLQHAQRNWIAFRDAECAFRASGVEGGSAQPMIAATCLADVTSARAEDLEAYLSCEEGDLSCPVPSE